MEIELEKQTEIPEFMGFLSKNLRDGKYPDLTKLFIARTAEDLVRKFANDPELCKSLKEDPNHDVGVRVMRQVDIRPEPGHPTVLMKCFVGWSHKKNCWYVMVEGPDETVWEEGKDNW